MNIGSSIVMTKLLLVALVSVCLIVVFHLLQSAGLRSSDDRSNHYSFFQPQRVKKSIPKHNIDVSKLSYGVEISYILPQYFLDDFHSKFNVSAISRTVYGPYFKNMSLDIGEEVVTKLAAKNVTAGFYGNRVRVPNAWTMARERGGFELASNINPPIQEIIDLMTVFKDSQFQIDAEVNAMHINIDARNRSPKEVGNVYKNFIALEKAINMMHTSSRVMASGFALSISKGYSNVAEGYAAMDDPYQLPYPSYHMRTLPDGTIQPVATKRSILCIRMSESTNKTRSFEFRGMQSSMDPNVLLAWVQFAKKFVATSYAGVVVEPIERSPEQQWEVLFDEIIQDPDLEKRLKQWRSDMLIPNPNRDKIMESICSFISKPMCHGVMRGIGKRKRRERQRQRWEGKNGNNQTTTTQNEKLNPKRAARKKHVEAMFQSRKKKKRDFGELLEEYDDVLPKKS